MNDLIFFSEIKVAYRAFSLSVQKASSAWILWLNRFRIFLICLGSGFSKDQIFRAMACPLTGPPDSLRRIQSPTEIFPKGGQLMRVSRHSIFFWPERINFRY